MDAVLYKGCAVCKSCLFAACGAVVWEGLSLIVTDGECITQHVEVKQTILWAVFTPMLACAHMYAHACAHMHACMHTHAYTHTHIYICTYTHTHSDFTFGFNLIDQRFVSDPSLPSNEFDPDERLLAGGLDPPDDFLSMMVGVP